MIEKKNNAFKEENAILVGLIQPSLNEQAANEYLDELAFLAETAGAKTIRRFTQKLPHPDSKTFIGKGKLEEIKNFIAGKDIRVAIFDDELSGSQINNIEKILDVKTIDRSDPFWTFSQTAQKRRRQNFKWSWHNINICCHDCAACGAILKGLAAASEQEGRAKQKLKQIDAL